MSTTTQQHNCLISDLPLKKQSYTVQSIQRIHFTGEQTACQTSGPKSPQKVTKYVTHHPKPAQFASLATGRFRRKRRDASNLLLPDCPIPAFASPSPSPIWSTIWNLRLEKSSKQWARTENNPDYCKIPCRCGAYFHSDGVRSLHNVLNSEGVRSIGMEAHATKLIAEAIRTFS